MYGLGALLRSRLYEDYHKTIEDDSSKKRVAKKKKMSKAVVQQIKRRDQYTENALQEYCVYEITNSRDILNEPAEVQSMSLSNYALTVLNMHIGNLSAKLQQTRITFQKSLQMGTVTTNLRIQMAEECNALARVLEQGAKLYRASFKLNLKRYYENMQLMQTQDVSLDKKTLKKANNVAKKIQKSLEKGMVAMYIMIGNHVTNASYLCRWFNYLLFSQKCKKPHRAVTLP
jgi:hypothetical protein